MRHRLLGGLLLLLLAGLAHATEPALLRLEQASAAPPPPLTAYLTLEDLGSTNGTQLNGVPIQGRHPLSDGDRIQIGRLDWRLSLPGAPP